MDSHEIVFYALIAIALAMLCRPLQQKTNLPFPIFLIIIGYVLSEVYVALGFDTGIRATNFHWISQFIFIPILLFTAAFAASPKMIFKEGLIHFIFAIPITILTIGLATVCLYYGIGHPTGFPWLAAFLTASILAVTGAHAIESFLIQIKIPHRLVHILQIESLFTTILAILFYNFFASLTYMPSDVTISFWLIEYLLKIIGGIFIGVILSYFIMGALKIIKESIAQAILIVAAVYGAYVLCEIWNVSGEFSVFVLGFFLGSFCRKQTFGDQHFIGKLFDSLYLLAMSGLFLMVGTVVTWSMFEERWLAMLIGIVAVLLARCISIYGGLSLYNFSPKHRSFSLHEQNLLILSGIRAALPIALAFGIPTTVDYWWTIQSIVFGVVLFGIFIQAPAIKLFSHHVIKKHEQHEHHNKPPNS